MSLAREINRAPNPIHISDAVGIGLLVGLELVALWLVVKLWREHGRSPASKLFWSVVTLLPLLGLVAYAVWRDPPPPRGPTDHPRGRDWDSAG